jgi:LysM repeat protein
MRLPKAIQPLLLAVVLILSHSLLQAQAQNLLTNSGFESNFLTVTGDQPRNVATGWVPWNVARTSGMASFQNIQPKYVAASEANGRGITPRIRSGSNAQIYYSFFETHDGGIYQQISGVTPGTELRFSIYAYVWSSTFEDPNVSDEPGDVALRVGIDPSGGTDGAAAQVVYSEPFIAYDTYREYAIIAKAESSTVTVFVRSIVGEPVQNTYIYLDDAILAPTTAATGGNLTSTPTAIGVIIPPSATNTAVPPTNTSIPPTATNTTVPSTNTTVPPTATNTTIPPTATNTSVPATTTNTPLPAVVVATNTSAAVDATPTPEGSGFLPTATSIGATLPPTSTSAPSIGGNDGGTRPISADFPGRIVHVTRRGDTVVFLASLYGSTIEAIVAANGLNENAFIRTGQALVIPVRIPNPATETPSPTPLNPILVVGGGGGGGTSGTTTYTVQPGDTLNNIALRYNTTLAALSQLNGITNPNRIFAGQRLVVPAATGGAIFVPTTAPIVVIITATPIQSQPAVIAPTPIIITATPAQPAVQRATYIVQPGDTLFRVATRFGVSMADLARANNITNVNLLFAGQTLVIPR